MVRKRTTIKKFIIRLNKRVENGEISKTKALQILRGKSVSVKRKRKLLTREDGILKKMKTSLMRKKR